MAVVGTLLLTSLVSFVAAGAFVYAGASFWRTRADAQRGAAARGFVTYWLVSAAYHALSGALGVLASLGVAPFGLFLLAKDLIVVLGATCLGGLAFYLLYLFTGRRGWLGPVVLFYGAVCAATIYYNRARGPTGVLVDRWRVDLTYASPLDGAATLIVLLLLLPQILGALAYATLVRRAPTPAQKYRVALIAAAIFVWFSSALAAELARSTFWQFVTRPGIGLAVAALVVFAYAPPAWARARWPPSPEELLDEALREEARRRREREADERLRERARELV